MSESEAGRQARAHAVVHVVRLGRRAGVIALSIAHSFLFSLSLSISDAVAAAAAVIAIESLRV